MTATFNSLHEYGYEGEIEEAVPVQEFHRAECTLCDWKSEEFDGFDWKSAEAEAIEHYENEHQDTDFDEDDDDDIP